LKFSICIPNYNYGKYIGRTIQSVLAQDVTDFEIIVSDNCSTDDSWDVITGIRDPRVKPFRNRCNVGFAGNLDRAAGRATGEFLITLSSDDVMRDNAIASYQQLFGLVGGSATESVVSSTVDLIDSCDHVTGKIGPDPELWKQQDRSSELEAALGVRVYSVESGELLRRCLLTMKNPFNFAATCFSRKLYEKVEGYGGGRLINPDKWFHWKVLAAAKRAYWIEQPLFAYRWHANNQSSIQAGAGALKYSIDEYVATLEIDEQMLKRANLTQEKVIEVFTDRDIARHGLATLARGERTRAKRLLRFGKAVYPDYVRKNPRAWALSALLWMGPFGYPLARWAYQRRLLRKSAEREPADGAQA
jgi:glycosyltransferase involved in cell wall biosynthesis